LVGPSATSSLLSQVSARSLAHALDARQAHFDDCALLPRAICATTYICWSRRSSKAAKSARSSCALARLRKRSRRPSLSCPLWIAAVFLSRHHRLRPPAPQRHPDRQEGLHGRALSTQLARRSDRPLRGVKFTPVVSRRWWSPLGRVQPITWAARSRSRTHPPTTARTGDEVVEVRQLLCSLFPSFGQ